MYYFHFTLQETCLTRFLQSEVKIKHIIVQNNTYKMKYYWIASTIEIKTTVLPCREIYKQNDVVFMSFLLILSHFRLFY